MAGTTEYKNNWQRDNKDTKLLVMPKGHKSEIEACAKSINETPNEFINKAIDERMERIQRKIKVETPFTPPPGELCTKECKKRCGMIPAVEGGSKKKLLYGEGEIPWCTMYGKEIADNKKCAECLGEKK